MLKKARVAHPSIFMPPVLMDRRFARTATNNVMHRIWWEIVRKPRISWHSHTFLFYVLLNFVLRTSLYNRSWKSPCSSTYACSHNNNNRYLPRSFVEPSKTSTSLIFFPPEKKKEVAVSSSWIFVELQFRRCVDYGRSEFCTMYSKRQFSFSSIPSSHSITEEN